MEQTHGSEVKRAGMRSDRMKKSVITAVAAAALAVGFFVLRELWIYPDVTIEEIIPGYGMTPTFIIATEYGPSYRLAKYCGGQLERDPELTPRGMGDENYKDHYIMSLVKDKAYTDAFLLDDDSWLFFCSSAEDGGPYADIYSRERQLIFEGPIRADGMEFTGDWEGQGGRLEPYLIDERLYCLMRKDPGDKNQYYFFVYNIGTAQVEKLDSVKVDSILTDDWRITFWGLYE